MSDLKVLSTENFNSEVLESGKPYLVDFWAPWCGPCVSMGPVIDEFSKSHGDKILVGKLNVDEHHEVAEKYKVMSIPTFSLFVDGKVEKTIVGSMDLKRLTENFQQWLI